MARLLLVAVVAAVAACGAGSQEPAASAPETTTRETTPDVANPTTTSDTTAPDASVPDTTAPDTTVTGPVSPSNPTSVLEEREADSSCLRHGNGCRLASGGRPGSFVDDRTRVEVEGSL